jgi:endonuclease III
MRSKLVWGNAKKLAEGILGDPDKLWHRITRVSLADWMSKRKEYALHWLSKAHERVWTIGKRIVEQHEGDARKIWDKQSIDATLYRLTELGVGPQISRMVVGALYDTGIISGKADVKVDIHVRRVLGRVFQGSEFSLEDTGKVIEITRKMHPQNPWLLDRPLYLLGQQTCKAKKPKCDSCYLAAECIYYENHV